MTIGDTPEDILKHYYFLQDSAEKYHRYRIAFTTFLLVFAGALISLIGANGSINGGSDFVLSLFIIIISAIGVLMVRTTHGNISSIERRSIQTLSVLAQRSQNSVIPLIERSRYFDNPGIDFLLPLNAAGKEKLLTTSTLQSPFDEKLSNFGLWKLHSIAFILVGCVGIILLLISL